MSLSCPAAYVQLSWKKRCITKRGKLTTAHVRCGWIFLRFGENCWWSETNTSKRSVNLSSVIMTVIYKARIHSHLATGFVEFSPLYDVTNDANSTPEPSFASRRSSLFRNMTNSTAARILLLHIACHSLNESVWEVHEMSQTRFQEAWGQTRRFTVSSSARTWLKPDIGAKKMMTFTNHPGLYVSKAPDSRDGYRTIVKELGPGGYNHMSAR